MSVPPASQQKSNEQSSARPSDDATKRTRGILYSEADRWSLLMARANGDRRVTHVLIAWRYVADHTWKVDGAARLRLTDAGKSLAVNERVLRRWFEDAELLGLIQKAGWCETKQGRMGKWLALPLPERLKSLATEVRKSTRKCPVNDRTQSSTTVSEARTQPSSTLSGQPNTASPVSPLTTPDVQGGSNSTNGSAQDPDAQDEQQEDGAPHVAPDGPEPSNDELNSEEAETVPSAQHDEWIAAYFRGDIDEQEALARYRNQEKARQAA